MALRRGTALSFVLVLFATAAHAGVAEDNIQRSAHAYDATGVSVTCEKAAPMTLSDGSLSVDWPRLALQVAAGAAASPATRTNGEIVPPRSPLKCDTGRAIQNP